MMKEVKPDAVIVCPSWEWHCRVTCDVMKMGAHAFVEVPMAVSIKELWEIVDTSEQTRKQLHDDGKQSTTAVKNSCT